MQLGVHIARIHENSPTEFLKVVVMAEKSVTQHLKGQVKISDQAKNTINKLATQKQWIKG